ncbi:hypothetical protein M404DRAFT_33652 [Pisolithus tinctorius Marx 270]|uniref:Uncharacterized protein n=1 Tax=Pisolithus tinctorius Marx 270 TaxID=870435 RepID=A0A0C3NL17_PISTI|nr:hypothetical protein M404DRAFT_33652 [Pisolithus tinctorius Marx 270]
MSTSRPTTTADNNSEGQAMVNWTQVLDDAIKYNTDDEQEMMRAKAKERKQCKWEEQARLEAKRAEREKAEAERAVWEAEQERACEEEEKHRAKEEKEADCTCCAWAQTVCEFIIDSNKKCVACMRCNLLKGKCCWPGDGKDTEAGPKAMGKVGKGKKRKADKENAKARPSNQKWVKMSMRVTEILDLNEPEAGRSRLREAGADRYSGLEDKLKRLIDAAGLIANNLASLFELHETAVENSGSITNALKSILNESYGFRMAVSPSDSGLSELDSDKLHKEAEWLKTHGEDEEEESKGEDESMAEAE